MSTLSISAGLAVAAVVLTGLWVSFAPHPGTVEEKPTLKAPPVSKQQRSGIAPDARAIRTVYAGPNSGAAQRINPAIQNGTAAALTPSAAAPAAAPSTSPAILGAAVVPTSPAKQADSTPVSTAPSDTAVSSGAKVPSIGRSVDLNAASVEELNALGAGMIGRRIIAFRPFASAEDLVARRVLKRADYEAIKAAITVRQTASAGTDHKD